MPCRSGLKQIDLAIAAWILRLSCSSVRKQAPKLLRTSAGPCQYRRSGQFARLERKLALSITLINPFYITSVDEVAFVESWKQTAAVFATKCGYLNTQLHRSIDPRARFRFVNVAHWESTEAWSEAMKAFPPREGGTPGVEANPALYTYVGGGAPEARNLTIRDELKVLEQGLAKAYQVHDIGFLNRLLADDYVVIDGPGTVSDKKKVLADHESGRLQVSAFHFDEMKIEPLTADAAVVIGQYTWNASYGGHPIDGTFRYLRVYVHGAHGWQIRAGQVTPVRQN